MTDQETKVPRPTQEAGLIRGAGSLCLNLLLLVAALAGLAFLIMALPLLTHAMHDDSRWEWKASAWKGEHHVRDMTKAEAFWDQFYDIRSVQGAKVHVFEGKPPVAGYLTLPTVPVGCSSDDDRQSRMEFELGPGGKLQFNWTDDASLSPGQIRIEQSGTGEHRGGEDIDPIALSRKGVNSYEFVDELQAVQSIWVTIRSSVFDHPCPASFIVNVTASVVQYDLTKAKDAAVIGGPDVPGTVSLAFLKQQSIVVDFTNAQVDTLRITVPTQIQLRRRLASAILVGCAISITILALLFAIYWAAGSGCARRKYRNIATQYTDLKKKGPFTEV
ncbi:uncharacterized protein EV422DRAFT_523706 [Fimicolochytrium jonesii]|uniref:uncharacterized protein n=1 Tax=Fimicolochytrium jonesii TaxID=1396493 RepID=UPI0022FE4A29|nr:uncharacterized protein EV422DRAFT_523706 [Fimicolochytrium jonesii]KAI8823192.1 hypothetical protein EV422DRAFT_523706 [Fimicolochytrium jonesii]